MDMVERKNLRGADFQEADFQEAELNEIDFHKAKLEEVNLCKAKNLSLDQLSRVKTLRNAKLDEELLIPLQKKYLLFFNTYNFTLSIC